MDIELQEDLIISWVRLTGLLKNIRLTRGMIFNEAVIVLIAYRRYRQDGVGVVSFREICDETKMLKSLVNRTIETLVQKGLLARYDGEEDRRTTYVRPIPENLNTYLHVHEKTLALAAKIIEIIGTEDAEAIVRVTNKLLEAGFDSEKYLD